MKVPGCRVFVVCLVVAVFLVWPVYSNPIDMSYNKFIITQNNAFFNESFNFTMNCYGYKMPPDIYINSAPTYGLVFSRSVSCLPGDCGYWNEYRSSGSLGITSCNIVGIYQGRPFTIENFTTDPESRCFSIENDFENKTSYLVPVKESEECWKKYLLAEDDCSAKYDRNNDLTKHNYYSCDKKLFSEKKNCAQDHGTLIKDPEILKYHATRYCELQINIPSDDKTPINSLISSTIGSPVESLYCSILNIFGARC